MTEEKCKQYIKSDGLKFCMSSVCPEKDCIYALVNKLHQTIDRLEQENEKLKKEVKQIGSDFIKKGDYARDLEKENKTLYEEKNCLHKIIDRLLENAGYSKDIASAEDFEDVYEDMQIKRNELIELEQENKRYKQLLQGCPADGDDCGFCEIDKRNKELKTKLDVFAFTISQYESALGDIKNDLKEICEEECDYTKIKFCGDCDCRYGQILTKINEVLNDK